LVLAALNADRLVNHC